MLIADFGELTKKGDSTAEALGKIGKDMDLSNIQGIADAGAALDALAVRGQISADQVHAAWQEALNGKDLQVFEVNARTAFDGSEQGARRLAAALDAQLGEALRRTGKDAGALSGGINQAAQLAINDFDVMAARLDEVKARGIDAGIALSASLNKAGEAASTEAAAKAVIDRWKELGQAGLVTGEQLTLGLEKAQSKLEELKPGINSLGEAFRTLGMKSPEELQKVARSAEEAFNVIKQGSGYTQTELANVREAFRRYAEAAIAANGGVATDTIRVKAEMMGLRVETDASGKAMVKMAEVTREAGDIAGNAAAGYGKLADSLDGVAESAAGASQSIANVKAPSGQSSGGSSNGSVSLDAYGAVMKEGLDKETTAKAAELANFYISQLIAQRAPGARSERQAIDVVNSSFRDGVPGWLRPKLRPRCW